MGGAEAKKTNTAETAQADTQNATAAKTDGKAAKGGKKDGEVKARQTFVRERGSKWTLERCRKYARRYKSEQEWIAGSPASYKAATYWNWVDQCCEHMPTNLRLVHSNTTHATTKGAGNKNNFKVVAGTKTGAHKPNGNPTNPPTAPTPAGNVHPIEKKSKTTTDKSTGTKKKKAS